jgi:CBS domain-containing protein
MFVGAVLGGVFGTLTHELAPGTRRPRAPTLAGMGGIIAGTTHAPFLAIIMVFELTQNYGIVLPLMLTSITAYWTARSIRRTSIYTEELKRRGMRWEGTAQERLLRSLTVRDIMLTDVTLYPATLPLEKVVDVFQNTRALQIYIGDDEGRLLGIVELHEVKRMMGEEPASFVIADDLVTEIPVVTPGDSLVEVNEKLWFRDLGQLPVVDDDETRKFLGIVTRRDVLGAFDREVLRRNRLLAKVRSVEGRIRLLRAPRGEPDVEDHRSLESRGQDDRRGGARLPPRDHGDGDRADGRRGPRAPDRAATRHATGPRGRVGRAGRGNGGRALRSGTPRPHG